MITLNNYISEQELIMKQKSKAFINLNVNLIIY